MFSGADPPGPPGGLSVGDYWGPAVGGVLNLYRTEVPGPGCSAHTHKQTAALVGGHREHGHLNNWPLFKTAASRRRCGLQGSCLGAVT